ncbi:hypothetical protein C8R44DRAFT_753811 [Mycena epipterygia]|nr:hypothetical protein C8R44DRAFT_753811 [Mycena epipterygia]
MLRIQDHTYRGLQRNVPPVRIVVAQQFTKCSLNSMYYSKARLKVRSVNAVHVTVRHVLMRNNCYLLLPHTCEDVDSSSETNYAPTVQGGGLKIKLARAGSVTPAASDAGEGINPRPRKYYNSRSFSFKIIAESRSKSWYFPGVLPTIAPPRHSSEKSEQSQNTAAKSDKMQIQIGQRAEAKDGIFDHLAFDLAATRWTPAWWVYGRISAEVKQHRNGGKNLDSSVGFRNLGLLLTELVVGLLLGGATLLLRRVNDVTGC